MRDAYAKFEQHAIKLYAISYDDQETLQEFSQAQRIPYSLLSDINSKVIRDYGILNTEVSVDDAFLHGIPFPGAYVCDENGKVSAKFFHDTYKKRDSAETFIDAALGRIELDEGAPQACAANEDSQLTVAMQGGTGSIRQGIIRKLVVRFTLGAGLHIYGEPVPEGMVATQVAVTGPPGLVALPTEYPPTHSLHLASIGADLEVWSGEVDIVVPLYAQGELVSETRPLHADTIDLTVEVRYQACTDTECLLPRTESFTLNVPLDVIDVPNLKLHTGHGQREGSFDSMPAMRRLIWRKVREHPLGLPRFLLKTIKLELAARKRKKLGG